MRVIEHRGLTINVTRTDDPMEPPGDDPEAEGPFGSGDFWCSVPEWGLCSGASSRNAGFAEKAAMSAIDRVLDDGIEPEAAMHVSGCPPVPVDGRATLLTEAGAFSVFLHADDGTEADPALDGPGWYFQPEETDEAPVGPYPSCREAAQEARRAAAPASPSP